MQNNSQFTAEVMKGVESINQGRTKELTEELKQKIKENAYAKFNLAKKARLEKASS